MTTLKTIALFIALSLLVLMAALAIQLGTKVVIVLAGVIVAPFMLFMPIAHLVYLILAMSFVVSGTLMYFAKLGTANWIPYLLCMLLLFRLLVERLASSSYYKSDTARQGMPAFMVALLLFFIFVLSSSIANAIPFGFWVLAFKNYLSIWLLAFVLWKSKDFSPHWLGIWNALLFVAVIQLPVALFQRLKSATGLQHSRLNWDAVVGTFGGDPEASGLSGAMGLFMVFSALLAGSLWRSGKLGTKHFLVVLCASILVIGMAEVKAAIVLLPFAAFYLFRDMPYRNPRQFIFGAIFVALLMVSLVYAYYLMYIYRDGTDLGFVGTLTKKFAGVFFDPYFIDRVTGEVGRLPALLLWWSGNAGDPFSLFFGHGPMAVRISSIFGPGEVIRQFTVNIGMYSLPVLLWELGVIAVCVFLLSLFLAIRAAYRLSCRADIPSDHRAVLNACAFGIFMITLFLPYNRDMIDSPAMQSLLAVFYAYVAYWWRKTPAAKQDQAYASSGRGAVASNSKLINSRST